MESSRYSKTYPVSWEQLHRDAKALAWRLMEHAPFAGLVAVTRGGMVPSAVIARELEIRDISTVCIQSYDWKNQGSAAILRRPEGDGSGLLVVDDLVDTGGTARLLREMLPRAHFAAVYAKPAGRPLVDTFVTEVSQDTWILFPWDAESQYVKPLAACRKDCP